MKLSTTKINQYKLEKKLDVLLQNNVQATNL